MKKKKKTNPSVALQYLISEAKESLKLMCEFYNENENRLQKIKEGNFNEKYSFPTKNLALCLSALKTRIVLLVSEMFDKSMRGNKQAISFRTLDFFTKSEIKKGNIDNLFKKPIIQQIIKTRNTFQAHIDEEIPENILIEQICNSNLKSILGELKNAWFYYNQWFIKNANWEEYY